MLFIIAILVRHAMQSNEKKIGLNDVYIIRPIAIFILIIYHSFIIYRGGWELPESFQPIVGYYIIASICCAFRLELLVFVSGYLFGLTLLRKQPTFKNTLTSKFKRLILPSIVFSTIYYYIFYYSPITFSFSHCILIILSGAGHMWYLPMLFWTMLICFGIERIKISEKFKIIGVLMFPLLSPLPLPFQLNQACYYTMYFYTGMLVFRNKDVIIEYLATCKQVIKLTIIFVALFVFGFYVREFIIDNRILNVNLISKALLYLSGKYLKIIYCIAGIFWIYALVNYLLEIKKLKIPQWIINLSAVCYGMYLFQQFILQYLYYYTDVPSIVGPYWLPWVGLAIATIGSYLLTVICRMTRIGRFIM